jgi:hypothetical protein
MPAVDTPDTLTSNAWCGVAASGPLAEDSLQWGARRDLPRPPQALAPTALDLDDWTNPGVGWGVILPDRDDVPAADKAVGADAPEPIRRLIAARGGAPVFRWRADLKEGRLRRYATDGSHSDPSLRGARGIAPNAVPRYLLIVASPIDVPWAAQYRLQTDAYIGRLDLEAEGLERYVEALLGEWSGAARNVHKPLLWCVDHGHPDITRLMRKTIAEKLRDSFAADAEFDVSSGFLSDGQATHARLLASLNERQPAFVATSSHGATFPLDDVAAMRSHIGALVDAAHTVVEPDLVGQAWNPRGAIWYAHACCSAGADASSRFAGLVRADSTLGQTLTAVAASGSCSAPLPRALLGGHNPIAAFIGHVEPTFDWTLRDPITGQVTSKHIVDALYATLHLARRPPIGRAMATYFDGVAGLLFDHADALDAIESHEPDALSRARRTRLMATDRLAMVILGDPTVRLPAT